MVFGEQGGPDTRGTPALATWWGGQPSIVRRIGVDRRLSPRPDRHRGGHHRVVDYHGVLKWVTGLPGSAAGTAGTVARGGLPGILIAKCS